MLTPDEKIKYNSLKLLKDRVDQLVKRLNRQSSEDFYTSKISLTYSETENKPLVNVFIGIENRPIDPDDMCAEDATFDDAVQWIIRLLAEHQFYCPYITYPSALLKVINNRRYPSRAYVDLPEKTKQKNLWDACLAEAKEHPRKMISLICATPMPTVNRTHTMEIRAAWHGGEFIHTYRSYSDEDTTWVHCSWSDWCPIEEETLRHIDGTILGLADDPDNPYEPEVSFECPNCLHTGLVKHLDLATEAPEVTHVCPHCGYTKVGYEEATSTEWVLRPDDN